MPKVLNKRTDKIPPDAIYVGRPSKWGNPVKIGQGNPPMDRKAVIDYYRSHYLPNHPELLSTLAELRGKDLVCWCSPLPCHAEVLIELANR